MIMKVLSTGHEFRAEASGGELGFAEKVRNFSAAVARIKASGFRLAEREERKRRGAVCGECEFWRKNGTLGLGECAKCGCSKYKRLFVAQGCPLGKW